MPIGSKRMSALYRGKGKTRPIPRDMFTEDIREQERNAIQTRPKEGPQLPTPNFLQSPQVSGRKIKRSTGGRSFNPVSNRKQR